MLVRRAAQSAEELNLLRGVLADLSDGAALGVYCDWLEDQDDSRGPFLRSFLQAFEADESLPPDPPDLTSGWADLLALPIRRRFLEGRGNQRIFQKILRAAQPTIRLEFGAPQAMKKFALGTSRAGGVPDLPVGAAWPTFEGSDKRRRQRYPLQFLVQIDLAELQGTIAEGLLPESGLLTIFQGDYAHDAALFTPAKTPLARVPAPDPGEDDSTVLFPTERSCALTLTEALRFTEYLPGMSENLWYADLDDPLNVSDLLGRDASERGVHYFCTNWKPRSRPMCGGNFTFDLVPRTYLELLSVDGHPGLRWGFGDGDKFHLFVPAKKARAGVFDTVRSVY
jgi:uncharacterized protein (TIGR02996 family)